VQLLEGWELGSAGPIGNAFVLHRSFLSLGRSPDDQSDARVVGEIPRLTCAVERIEDDLEAIGHGNAHDGRLDSA
jgi:hypothetical protein